jgi:ribosomal protein S6
MMTMAEKITKAKSSISDQKSVIDKLQKMPIGQHPDYNRLRKKYAVQDNTTCPATYKPCGSSRKMAEQITKAKSIISDQKAVIDKLKKMSIGQHPGYRGLMQKYAAKDNTTCPETYKPCGSSHKMAEQITKAKSIISDQKAVIDKLKKMPIGQHLEYRGLMQKYAVKDSTTCPETYKPRGDSRKMAEQITKAKSIISDQKAVIDKLKKMPIGQHPEYRGLMQKYAVKDNTTCPATYKPCGSSRKAYVDINNHPDIHKYILKSQLPALVDKECRRNFSKKNSTK